MFHYLNRTGCTNMVIMIIWFPLGEATEDVNKINLQWVQEP